MVGRVGLGDGRLGLTVGLGLLRDGLGEVFGQSAGGQDGDGLGPLGPGDGVSVHVLCRTPADHPHRFWDRNTEAVHPYPFIEVKPDRWRSEVMWDQPG